MNRIVVMCSFACCLAFQLNAKTVDSTRTVIGLKDENRRIWHEILHDQPCRIEVEIFAANGSLVRHYYQGALGRSICNWYWDAKNDSDQFVEPGKYRAVITDCNKPFYENMTIAYAPGEKNFSIPDSTQSLTRGLLISILADSLSLSVQVLSVVDTTYEFQHLQDTLLTKGIHALPFTSDHLHPQSRVRLVVHTAELERIYEMTLLR